jgi:hypothetical protein
VRRMQADAWADFWQALGLALYRSEDVGLSASSTDLEVWNVCQDEQLILITDNFFRQKNEPTLRQESSGEEDSHKLETFRREPCG